MSPREFNRQLDQDELTLARKVARMGMLIHRYYGASAHRHGGRIDPLRGQGRVLALLKAKPETTQRELSYLLDMRQQSLSELLAKLEEKGYVTRNKSAEDGRVTVVRLTEAGADAAPSPQQMEDHADALEFLSADEQSQLETLTDKVTAELERKLEAMGIDPHQGPRGPRGHRGEPDGPCMRGPHGHHGPQHGPHHGPYHPQGMHDDHGMRRA